MTKRFWGFKRLGTTRDERNENGLRRSFSGGRFRSQNGGRTHFGALKLSSVPIRKRLLQRTGHCFQTRVIHFLKGSPQEKARLEFGI